MTLQSRWWDVCWVQRKGRGGGFGRQISQVWTHWTRCVWERERTCGGNCRAPGSTKSLCDCFTRFWGMWRSFLKMDMWPPKERRFPFSSLDPLFLSCSSNKGLKCAETWGFLGHPTGLWATPARHLTGRNVAHPGQEEKRPQICVRTTHVLKDVHLQY